MGFIPLTSAQARNALSTVFFVNEDNAIAIWEARDEPETTKSRRYDDNIIKIEGKPVTSGSKDLAALAYKWSDQTSTRVYYADSDNKIQELCKDEAGDWFIGSIANYNLQAAPGTSICSHVNYAYSQLNVYFYPAKDPGRIQLAWTTLGGDKWETRYI